MTMKSRHDRARTTSGANTARLASPQRMARLVVEPQLELQQPQPTHRCTRANNHGTARFRSDPVLPAEELHSATRLRTEVVRRDLDRSQSQARVRIAQDDVGIVSPADVAWLPADALYVGLGAESPIL